MSACTHLTEFGIQKIVNDRTFKDPVLQIIEYEAEKKQIGTETLFCAHISDGNAKLRCYFSNELLTRIESSKDRLNNQVIMLKTYGATSKSVLVYQYDVVVDHYDGIIGSPVSYKDFIAGGNNEPLNMLRPDRIMNKLLTSQKKPVIEKLPPTGLSIKKQKIALEEAGEFDNISDLYPDLHSWKIYCRITKMNYSEFESRQKKQIKLLNLELMDRKGTSIGATIFGDYGERMSKELEVGDTYIFSKGMVKVDNYKKGSSSASEYVLSFTENSKITPTSDDKSIQNQGATVTPIAQIKNKEPNCEVDIIGIIKEVRSPTQIQAKSNQKNHKKQTIVVCDPVSKTQIDATMWNLEKDFDHSMENKTYLLSNFKTHEYNGTLNISSSFKSSVTPVEQHEFRKYENAIGSMSFETISYRRDESAFKVIRNIKEMEAAKENMEENGAVWSDLRVYLNRIRDKAKRTYDGCPHCKKGVQPEDTSCSHCQKSFDKPRARYILSIELSDYSGSIWTTAYDDFAEKMFKVAGEYPADEVKGFSEKQFEELSKQCLFQEFKIKVVTKYENSSDGQKRAKNTITKTFPMDYLSEARSNLEYIRKRL